MSAGRSCGSAQRILNYSVDDIQDRKSSSLDFAVRVLVVDDDPTIRRFLKRVLSKNWEVDLATNARDAANMLTGKKYHALVTDYDMPGENGLWLLAFAKRYFPATLRILSSGSEDMHIDSLKVDDLVDYALPKPLDSERLCEILDENLI
jgi:DNA-binding NtrC family response regulator